ncbi:hypothetical protein PB2503_13659 [Parvularcula bermudensis HTCC2503]|uniref:Uncharacterized protein n=1 Tax=Parvularcula bermudensis (strain ATCC BAA-594 / HTCC2503 / KCTC 12087) TaxID=314260 RepID=E0THH7_PARBH|nr:hypothetical protein [Parvularcula bermudensis]ADM10769.1 hypothetical protein PB2503_13659 [Parvularcula bermudensis HTCC2503]
MSPIVLGIVAVIVIGLGVATWKAPRLTSVILWSLIATLFIGAAALDVLPGAFSEKALWLTLAVPLIWAGLQFWTYWEKRAWRVAAALLGVTAVCGTIVFFFEPVVG